MSNLTIVTFIAASPLKANRRHIFIKIKDNGEIKSVVKTASLHSGYIVL